jgi:predicted metal-dependent peptidase
MIKISKKTINEAAKYAKGLPNRLNNVNVPSDVKKAAKDFLDLADSAAETLEKMRKTGGIFHRNDRIEGTDVSKIEEIDVILPDGTKDKCRPAQVAALARHFMNAMENDRDLRVLRKYFPRNIIWTFSIATAATDGIRIAMNPYFADQLFGYDEQIYNKLEAEGASVKALNNVQGTVFQFVIVHEIYHQLYQHNVRGMLKSETANGANHNLANIAMDVEINRDIELHIPKFRGCTELIHGMWDERFNNGEFWETIFDAYYNKEANPPMNPNQMSQPQPGNEPQSGQGESNNGQGESNNGQGESNNGQGESNNGQDQQESDDFWHGYYDEIKKLHEAVNNGTYDVTSFLNFSTGDIENQADYDRGVEEAKKDFAKYMENLKKLQDQQNQSQKNRKGGIGNGNSNSNNSDSEQGQNPGRFNGQQSGEEDSDQDDQGGTDKGNGGFDKRKYPAVRIPTQGFDGADRIDKETMEKIAEGAGQPYDMNDIKETPEKKSRDFVDKHGEELSKIGSGSGPTGSAHGQGSGLNRSSLGDILNRIKEMLKPQINWKKTLRRLFKSYTPTGTKQAYSRRLLGSNNPDLKDAKYMKPRLKSTVEKNAIAQVFHLVDYSGSMHSSSKDGGKTTFDLIFGEIINMEKAAKIQKSAMTYYASGIYEDAIRTWDYKVSKQKILDLVAHRAGDAEGGTSFCTAVKQIIDIGKPYYSYAGKEPTLLIFYTDGEDSYTDLKQLPLKVIYNMVAVIINNVQQYRDDAFKELTQEVGFSESHVICIDPDNLD